MEGWWFAATRVPSAWLSRRRKRLRSDATAGICQALVHPDARFSVLELICCCGSPRQLEDNRQRQHQAPQLHGPLQGPFSDPNKGSREGGGAPHRGGGSVREINQSQLQVVQEVPARSAAVRCRSIAAWSGDDLALDPPLQEGWVLSAKRLLRAWLTHLERLTLVQLMLWSSETGGFCAGGTKGSRTLWGSWRRVSTCLLKKQTPHTKHLFLIG